MDAVLDSLMWFQIVVALAAGLVVMLIYAAVKSSFDGPAPAERRLMELLGEKSGHQDDSSELLSVAKKGMISFFKRLAPTDDDKPENWEKSKIRRDLQAAGFRGKDTLAVFTGLRIFFMFALPLTAYLVGVTWGAKQATLLIAAVIGAGLGFLLPGYVVEKMAMSRGTRISRELPNMLDLLVVAVESGLGLDAAVVRVSRDMAGSSPLLTDEFKMFSLETRLGVTREEALRNLARRTGVEEIGSLAGMLIQADRFGVSIGRSLRVFADELRTRRRQLMEEKAAKIPLKLLFPVLFMIFPAIMAVIAGPAVINIMESMF